MKFSQVLLGSLAFAIPVVTASATAYTGNGQNSFGGPVGNGILTITSTNTTITFSEASASNLGGNVLVLYLDVVANSGFVDTSAFTDDTNNQTEAISGYNAGDSSNGGSPTRALALFPSSFGADYAVAFDGSNVNAFSLGGTSTAGTINFIANAPQNTTPPYAITLSLASLGLTTSSKFNFVGTLISSTAYRSNEAIGTFTSTTTGSPGFSTPITFTNVDTFSVPEPGSMATVGLGLFALAGVIRRRVRA